MKVRVVPRTWRLARPEGGNGDLDVIVEDFVYITIHYDYRFTCNAHQWQLGQSLMESLAAEGDVVERPI